MGQYSRLMGTLFFFKVQDRAKIFSSAKWITYLFKKDAAWGKIILDLHKKNNPHSMDYLICDLEINFGIKYI